ncbi:MAG: hypothetical protein ACKPJF_06975, partial [Dolichospermum sp.]
QEEPTHLLASHRFSEKGTHLLGPHTYHTFAPGLYQFVKHLHTSIGYHKQKHISHILGKLHISVNISS